MMKPIEIKGGWTMEKKGVQGFVRLALLLALEVVLSRFLSISTPYVKISFAFLPLALAGMMYGPAAGAAVGGLADFLGAMLFPVGPFFPGFTLTAALRGATYGSFLHRGGCVEPWKVAGAVAVGGIVLSLGMNTLWISLLYDAPYWGLLPPRLLQEGILMPLQFVMLMLVGRPKVQQRLKG